MTARRIGIVGGTGGMGRLFAGVLARAGHDVTVSGRREGPSPEDLARACEVVVISVPITATAEVIRRVGPAMAPDALLTDLTSLKVEPVREMLAAARGEVVGMHPLCGPSVPSLAQQNVVLCPGRGERGLIWLRDLLTAEGANVVTSTPELHDERMAVVQGLNHLNTLLMGLMLARAGVPAADLAPFSTPAFRAKLDLVQRVARMPQLYARLIADNPRVCPLAEAGRPAIDDAFAAAAAGDAAALERLIEIVGAAVTTVDPPVLP
jgi:prephenate dehydrogenase